MRFFPLLTLAGLTALAGCGYTGPIYFTPPASQFAVQVPASAESRVQNYVHAEVITLLEGVPVKGAICGLKSAEIDSGFVSPAMIDLPVYHRPPPPATLSCTYGQMHGSKTVHAHKVAEVRAEPDPRSVEMLISLLSNAVADGLNMWTYARRGDQIIVELGS